MACAAPAAGFLALQGPMCGMQEADAASCGAVSPTSSGWSTGTQALEQQTSWQDSLLSLQPRGDQSTKHPAAQLAAGPAAALQQQQAAAAGAGHRPLPLQQPWQPLCLQPPAVAGPALPADVQVTNSTAWRYGNGSSSNFGPLQHAAQPPPPPQQDQQQGLAEADPWSCGLDLLAVGSAADDAALPLPITDASLDALLAPFEDWPFVLQQPTAASAAAPAEQQEAEAPAAAAAGTAAPAPLSSGDSGAPAVPQQPAPQPQPARRNKGGRPRVHHPKAPTSASAASASGQQQPGLESAGQPFKKSSRGPKPKYVFTTQEEAADARRERNRKAALESYYRRKEHTQRLQGEIAALQAQNAALQQLLGEMAATGLCPLPEASNEGIDMWLRHHDKAAPAAASAPARSS